MKTMALISVAAAAAFLISCVEGATCGGEVAGSEGTISSPGFPLGRYPHGIDCVWTIRVPVGHHVRVSFTGNIGIESGRRCSYDYLRLYDGDGTDDPHIITICGYGKPNPRYSSGNTMTIRFHSDYSVSGIGFGLVFTASNETEPPRSPYRTSIIPDQPVGRVGLNDTSTTLTEGVASPTVASDDTPQCGGEYNESTGVITSPNYPDIYPHSTTCRWVIHATPGHIVSLTFSDLQLEASPTCSYDYVRVYRSLNDTAPTALCGSQVPSTPIVSDGSTMVIIFSSDMSVTGRGFNATYTTQTEASASPTEKRDSSTQCGGERAESTGVITSPSYPDRYPRSTTCRWTIRAAPGHIVSLTFSDFQLEGSRTCAYDYVRVYTRLNDTAPTTLCGSQVPSAPIVSDGRTMIVMFASDMSITGRGFNATYTTQSAASSSPTKAPPADAPPAQAPVAPPVSPVFS